ncbi:MAG: MIP/aquaporin family protein [Planctomycetota bacterium]
MSNPVLPSKLQCFWAELFGTFVLVFFGCGVVHSSVCYGAPDGLWQVAIVWGIAIMLAIYSIGGISGAHINPAITIALSVVGDFPKNRVATYILAQLCGAFLAAASLFFLFSPALKQVETDFGVQRGQQGSEITASCYGEFFPSPGSLKSETYSVTEHKQLKKLVPHHVAFFAEVLGTAILSCMVFAFSDSSNRERPDQRQAAIFIGLTVSALISVIAPLTQACFNPARDFGPRLFASLAGWGKIALPIGTDWGWLTVYIVAPILGACIGGLAYQKFVQPMHGSSDGSEDS